MRTLRFAVLLAVVAAVPALLGAQAPVTTADITRLDTAASEVQRLATSLRSSDPTLAGDVERSLAELRDEVAYLRVKLRRNEAVTREEYASVRDRLETLRVRAGGQAAPARPATPGAAFTVPVGTELDARLQAPLSSATAKVEQRFEATTIVAYTQGATEVIPAGSIVRGFVSSVRAAGRVERQGSMTLSFDEIRIGNRSQRLRASVVQALDGKMAEDMTRVGAGAVVGGIIGGLLGGGKGALLGVLVGGGGTLAATEGSDVELPAGTVLRIRIDEPLDIIR
jgi:hypothetical protein